MGLAPKRGVSSATCEAKVASHMQQLAVYMYRRDKVEESSSCRFGVNEACERGGGRGGGVSLTGCCLVVARCQVHS